MIDLANRLDETTGTFMDTAAVMKSLDLVITADTAVAHFAEALGVPVWVALPFVPDWRWLLERTVGRPGIPPPVCFARPGAATGRGSSSASLKPCGNGSRRRPRHAPSRLR